MFLNHIPFNFFSGQNGLFVRFSSWYIRFEKHKALKRELAKELMPVAWHRWPDWCVSEDEKKEIDQIFIKEL